VNQRVKRRNIGLLDSEPAGLSGRTLTIQMASSGHRDKLKASKECQRALAAVLQEMYGRAFRFRLSLGAPRDDNTAPSPPSPAPGPPAGEAEGPKSGTASGQASGSDGQGRSSEDDSPGPPADVSERAEPGAGGQATLFAAAPAAPEGDSPSQAVETPTVAPAPVPAAPPSGEAYQGTAAPDGDQAQPGDEADPTPPGETPQGAALGPDRPDAHGQGKDDDGKEEPGDEPRWRQFERMLDGEAFDD